MYRAALKNIEAETARRTQMLLMRRRVRAATERAQFKAAVVSPVDKTGPAANRATEFRATNNKCVEQPDRRSD